MTLEFSDSESIDTLKELNNNQKATIGPQTSINLPTTQSTSYNSVALSSAEADAEEESTMGPWDPRKVLEVAKMVLQKSHIFLPSLAFMVSCAGCCGCPPSCL